MSDRSKKPCSITISRTINLPESSILEHIHYSVNEKLLQIAFHPQGDSNYGQVYVYYDVPEDVVKEMIKAKSAGSFFRENIRDKYRTENIS